MAKRYTATAQLRFRKQHACSSCGCVYSYVMQRKITGTGATPQGAGANMQKMSQRTQRDENDLHPCPNCGQFQQDMVGLRLAKRRKIVACLAVVMPILVPILAGTHAVQTYTLTWIAFVYGAVVLVLHILLSLYNPNRDREANRGVAANQIVDGTLFVKPMTTTPEPNTPALARPTQSTLHLATMVVLLGAAPLTLVPDLLRAVRGWPLNEECYPAVAGPADTTRIYMEDSIRSVKGFWRGNPVATCETADGAAPISLAARTNQNDWGTSIYAKSDEKQNTSHPWVEVTFPDKADLAGKTVICRINLDVQYPEMMGTDSFREASSHMQRQISIRLATSGAGGQYSGLWWTSTVLALLGDFAGSIALVYAARSYQRKAKPTQVMPADQT